MRYSTKKLQGRNRKVNRKHSDLGSNWQSEYNEMLLNSPDEKLSFLQLRTKQRLLQQQRQAA